MKLTLKSLQAEINERVDRILLKLDTHIKKSNSNFREINQCFEQVDQRFDKMELNFHDEIQRNFRKFTGDIAASLSPYLFEIGLATEIEHAKDTA